MSKDIAERMCHLQQIIRRFYIRQSDDNPEITKQYGYLKFDENELDSTTYPAQYIRLALQTNPSTIVEYMQYGWCLPTPNLIISVVGGGKQCNMSAHLRKTFQRGLAVAAATTNAWLITTGTNVGVVKEVGKALNNYRYKSHKHVLDVPCIGICTWEYITGNEQLERLDMTDEHNVHSYIVGHGEANQCDLESNHTHFLLFDGQSSDTNTLLLQRANIEKYSRRINMDSSNKDAPIPIVMILADGGLFSARTVCQALESNTPLVVVKGSGRAADLVADLYEFFSPEKTVQDEKQQQGETEVAHSKEDELNLIFERSRANNNNTWIDEMKHDLCEVLCRRKQLVIIFEFDSQRHRGNLEDAILEALFNATKFSDDHQDEQQCRVAELKLAMAWQKFDYAKKYILTDTTIAEWTETDLCQALVEALERDYIDFIELLMDYGASLEKLTLNDLEQLYASSDINNGLPLRKKSEEDSPTRNIYYSCYFPNQSHFKEIALDKNLPLGQHAVREFFLWAIFVDRFALATYLCSKTWNQSVAPLIAAHIYRLASTMARHSETKECYKKNALQFDKYAKSIIDRCFDNDEYFAIDLLKQPAVTFNDIVPLDLAEQTRCQAFLASKCVQKYLEQKWFGHINYKRPMIHLRIFLCTLFLPLLPIFSLFLPYVYEHQQTIRNDKNAPKNRRQNIIRTRNKFDGNDRIPWMKKIFYFYRAPIVRFCYNVIFFVLFLGLFSSVLLTDFWPLNIHYKVDSNIKNVSWPIAEIVLHICAWSLIIEEFRQFSMTESHEYFSNMWNLTDIIAIILYLIALITRFSRNETLFIISKTFFCLDLIIWFLGTLHLFTAFERLGPKLMMIFNTMKDLFFFLCFIFIFLCAFSITSWSLLTSASQVNWIYSTDGRLVNVTKAYEGKNLWSWQLLRNITHYGVWKVFGQVDPIVGTDSYSTMAFILAIVFVAIANILLLNVLIALFNFTIQNVQEQSHDLWRYQRFLLVNEFNRKTPLPPPFNIVYYIFITIRFLVTRIKIHPHHDRFMTNEPLLNDIKTDRNIIQQQQFRITDIMRWEASIAEDYWHDTFKHDKNDRMEVILQNIERKIDDLASCRQDNTSVKHQSKK